MANKNTKMKKSSTNIWIWFIVLFVLWQVFKFGVLRDGFKKEPFTPERNKELNRDKMKEMIEKMIKEKNLKKD